MKPNIVEITEVEGSIDETLKKILKNFSFRPHGTVFLKPNVCAPEYSPGAVTSPSLLYDLVSILRDKAEEVIVGESDGYNYSCSRALMNTGIAKAVDKAGGRIVNLSEDEIIAVNLRNSKVKKLFLPKTLIEADSVIDVPVMKTHEYKIYSGAIKNLFGCIPDDRRIFLHPQLNEVLLQLFKVIDPELVIMDAIVAMEGNGPTKGNPVKLDLIITGNNALSVDLIASSIMGLNWKEIDYLNHIAQETGFKEEDISLVGCNVSSVAQKFELPRIDLPVETQLRIYKSLLLTKILFCSLGVVKLFQGVTSTYRKIRSKK